MSLRFVEQCDDLRQDRRPIHDGLGIASGVFRHRNYGTEIVARVDHEQQIEGLEGFGEATQSFLVGGAHRGERLYGVQDVVGVAEALIPAGPVVPTERTVATVQRWIISQRGWPTPRPGKLIPEISSV